MRCTFKTVFYVNGSKERNGIVPIMGRVTINGTIAQFSCKQSVTKAIWDAKGNRAIGKSKEAKEVNFALDNIKAQIAKHYQRLSDREAFVTAEMVRNAYQGIGTEYETLLRAFDKENAAFAKRVGKDRAKNTYNKYLVVRKYVAEFIKYQYKRSDMSMNELTEEFIRDYCLYLKSLPTAYACPVCSKTIRKQLQIGVVCKSSIVERRFDSVIQSVVIQISLRQELITVKEIFHATVEDITIYHRMELLGNNGF